MASSSAPQARPEVGDVLIVVHDFKARSSDELSLSKGDHVELLERDDEFGDGWFLGKHMVNGNSGLFPEVYTRPAPKNVPPPSAPIATLKAPTTERQTSPADRPSFASNISPLRQGELTGSSPQSVVATPAPAKSESSNVTLPLNSPAQSSSNMASGSSNSFATHQGSISGTTSRGRLSTSQDRNMLHETLHVINEHITDMRAPPMNGSLPSAATDSGSEYSSHIEHRMSYIQGDETDEEEEGSLSRAEVEAWTPDEAAEYLFTSGVDQRHCEVFRDQEITGEVLLGMDQSSLFLKPFDLGSVGRRLKTWQKIKALQDEVSGLGPSTRRTTQTYGSDAGSDRRMRSRTNTLTGSIYKVPFEDGRKSSQGKRTSVNSTLRMDPTHTVPAVSPQVLQDSQSPTRPSHEKRPSAASIRDLHHSRRHSSNDSRLSTGAAKPGFAGFAPSGSSIDLAHRKQASFDRNWTLGSATASASALNQRPLSSAGFPGAPNSSDPDLQNPAADLDRGYFSSTDVDTTRRYVLRKRGSTSHSRKSSYAEEQRIRSGTAITHHSRYASVDSVRDQHQQQEQQQQNQPSVAAQQYYGLSKSRRTSSTHTTDSMRLAPAKDAPSPTVTKLENNSITEAPDTASASSSNRTGLHGDWLMSSRPSIKSAAMGLRAISDAVTGHERSKVAAPADSPLKESPINSPSRAGSSTPSVGPSFELESPEASKSPSIVTTSTSHKSRKKSKKDTSAYTRGLQNISPRQAIINADYSGWMKKKSSNLMTTWKPRLFVLKGRRLAYYYSEDDDQEKGLIDISFHRVLPADNEKLTGLHATLTGASNTPAIPAGSNVQTLARADEAGTNDKGSDSMFIFKLVPPRAGLSRAVNFTKPTVHYFAVPNIKQGRLWMAALVKATIDRDDSQPITTTYQQKTISLTKARQMHHRPPALMGLEEKGEDDMRGPNKDSGRPGTVLGETDSGVSGLDRLGLHQIPSTRLELDNFGAEKDTALSPKSA